MRKNLKDGCQISRNIYQLLENDIVIGGVLCCSLVKPSMYTLTHDQCGLTDIQNINNIMLFGLYFLYLTFLLLLFFYHS